MQMQQLFFFCEEKVRNKVVIYLGSEIGEECKNLYLENEREHDLSDVQHVTNKKHISSRPNKYFKRSVLGIGVKYIQLSFASGKSGPATLVFALESMDKDGFQFFELRRFTTPTSFQQPACIYFCKTRNGTAAMYQHWFQHVVIPTMVAQRNYWSESKDEGTVQPMFFSMDSEATIMNQATTEGINALFRENSISFAKLSAGTTAIHQACDRSPLFHAIKRRIKQKEFQKFLEKSTEDTEFDGDITNMFEKLKNSSIKMTPSDERNIRRVIVILHTVLNQVMTLQCIASGFSVCGQHTSSLGSTFTVSIRTILEQCYTNYTEEAIASLEKSVMLLSNTILSKGKLSYQDMIDAGVTPNEFTINRDNKPLANRWAELITHDSVRQELKLQEERKRIDAELNAPNYVIRQKEIKAASILVQRHEKKEQRAAQKKREREEKLLANAGMKKKKTDRQNRNEKRTRKKERDMKEAIKKKKVEQTAKALQAAKQLLSSTRT
jgi:hypothetical protein